MSENSVAA